MTNLTMALFRSIGSKVENPGALRNCRPWLIATAMLMLTGCGLRQEFPIQGHLAARLDTLGRAALAAGEVPVAAILLYRDSIIGEGFNDVLITGNSAGHAEINAISAAMKNRGVLNFRRLDRDSMVLISTFEPCHMCQGAFIEHRIKKVIYLKRKPIFYVLKEHVRYLKYWWGRSREGPASLQDSLFGLHPEYIAK